MKASKHIKMSELVERNYHLIGILSRLGMKGSFSDRTVEEVCKRYGFDADTFILLCSVYSEKLYKPTDEELQRCDVEGLLRYLHSSHEYYLKSALTSISPSIEEMIAPTTPVQQSAIRKFYEDYRQELERHFAFEEETVIPYIRGLLDGHQSSRFSISDFEENHSNVDESLSDLKSIIMQSLPPECDGEKRMEVLSNIFHLQEDLRHHTYIEDSVLVPLVQMLEGRRPRASLSKEADSTGAGDEPLSDREKEVLVLVAKGLLNKEIADRLNISINTVITHRKNITRKTGIKTAPGLTVYAILGGLISIENLE
ncbi:MAG: hemerythrin domain-containing protein [Bacteroidales bacterium]|nr:hemerythrin domain-containing protein [Bacteroidales bacterium]